MSHCVPPQLIVQGLAPRWAGDEPPTCRECAQPYPAHSGKLCVICREPVEHHTDPDEMALERAGAARMADAQRHVGMELQPWQEWVLSESEER